MNQSPDEARLARIQKYKEERRKQLTARTATLFSANVTERRPRKATSRAQSDDTADHLKSTSDLNLNLASNSVSIRTTRTSRLRAAAATHSDSSPSPRKSNRSSSVQSLLEDTKKTPKSSRIIDRDKQRLNSLRRQSKEKENSKSLDKEIGAIKTKLKHSNKVILEKDKCNILVHNSKQGIDLKGDIKLDSSKFDHKQNNSLIYKDEDIFDDILIDNKGLSDSFDKQKIEDLFNDLVVDEDDAHLNVENFVNTPLKRYIGINDSHKENIPMHEAVDIDKVVNIVNIENSGIVPEIVKTEENGGLLGAVCVRKVEKFSELLSNLCSPCEADILFEDVLVENGIDGDVHLRNAVPECTPPCRRAQPSPRTTSTPMRDALLPSVHTTVTPTGTTSKTRYRRPFESPHPKTENPLPSSRVSPKSAFNLSFGLKSPLIKSSPPNTFSASKQSERRRSSDNGVKPSCIPLSKKTAVKHIQCSPSPTKPESSNKTDNKPEEKTKLISPRGRSYRRSPDKANNSESNRNDRRQRAQKDSESASEKYHYSKKRLTSIENNSNDTGHNILKNVLKNKTESFKSDAVSSLEENKDTKMLSTLQETVRPHTSSSRLSQEMDSLAALTKQTLDRVNKLSNNLTSNKLNIENPEQRFDSLFGSTSEQKCNNHSINYGLTNDRPIPNRGVTERLKDIDTAAQRLLDFEKQSAMFSDLNDTSSQNRRLETSTSSCSHTPVSILKRKSINEENAISNASNLAIASPPVTFSPSVVEPSSCRSENRQRQGILKKRRSLDESQVARRRSCSPEVSFADDGSIDSNKPILKNRRSSLEDVVRNRSPDGQIQGILKRKMSREEDLTNEDVSHGSPEPHGILKRKSNSSSSSSTTSSHVSIAQAVLLAAAGGAELVEDDKETVRPILKKKSFSEERPCPTVLTSETPKPILKKKSIEHDEHDFELPKKPILKLSKKGEDGHSSSFDLSEDDRSSRRPSLLRSRTSDHSGSECEAVVRPILKQRGSSLTRERSQSPRPRLSFCADSDANISVTNPSSDANDLQAAGPQRLLNSGDKEESYSCAVLHRRNLRPKTNPRSKSLVCDVNDELLSILNNRRLKVEENCENSKRELLNSKNHDLSNSDDGNPKSFPSIAARIKSMEQALTKDVLRKDKPSTSRYKTRDKERFKTQPITVEEMQSVTCSLEPGQASFQAFGIAGCSFPSVPDEAGAAASRDPLFREPERDPFKDFSEPLNSQPFGASSFNAKSPLVNGLVDSAPGAKDDSYGEATFLDFENIVANVERKQSTLDQIEQEVNKVRVALDEDSRALEEDERQQAEADNWSLNVSCDSGVYNRASSRDSGPHSGEELGLIESQEIHENHATNSSSNEWSSSSVERGLHNMERQRKSTENEARSPQDNSDDEAHDNSVGFALGLVKSNSVVARASMWQQLQQQAKGTAKPLIRHSRSKNKDVPSVADRFKTQPLSFPTAAETTPEPPNESFTLAQSKSSANMLDRDEDAKLDEDDPAKMSLCEKMKMFNAKLTHKPPVAGLPRPKEDRQSRASRLRTMPVLASQVQEAMEQNERLTKSLTHEEVPRNPDFQLKMELFRSASAKNTSLQYLMRQNSKFRSLDLDDDSPTERAQRMITPEVRGILKSGSTVVPAKSKTLAKGESSEGLKDEGIDSSSDDESVSASSVSSSEKSISSSESSDDIPGPKPRRFQRKNNKLQSSRTDSDLTKLKDPVNDPRKIQLPGAAELKERLVQAKNPEIKPLLGKLCRKQPEPEVTNEEDNTRYRRFIKKIDEPIQLGKLRRPPDTTNQPPKQFISPPPTMKISTLNQAAKNKFFGLEEPKKERSIDELTAAVRRYIPPVTKSMSVQVVEGTSGSDGESSGGREVRRITARGRHRGGGGLQRSATHAEMPHRGGTIAERLAALQAAGANDWRARVCRLSPDREDSKAIERAKNRINDSLNTVVVNTVVDDLRQNVLAERRNKLETASQGWRKRVPQTDASLFTVAGRLERDMVTATPPVTPPPAVTAPALTAQVTTPVTTPAVPSPAVPTPNKFRSRKQQSPTNGFASGPLRSASCAVVSAANIPDHEPSAPEREPFKRSHSVSESISCLDEDEEVSPGAEKSGCPVRVPRADDETFHAFFAPLHEQKSTESGGDVDLDAIDSGSRQLLSSEWSKRARCLKRHQASGNPLKALAARTDLRQEYRPLTPRRPLVEAEVTNNNNNTGLSPIALAALASKEDFSNVALRSANNAQPTQGLKPLMMIQIKGRRRVQTRLVEPVHTNLNRGDCFILINSEQVFLYIGFYANVIERNRSTDIANYIHKTKDLGCKATEGVIKIDEQTKNYTNKQWNQFWSLLGVTEGVEEYKPVETGHADEDEIFESCIVQTNMCYQVMDDELVPIKEYWGQMPKIAMLHQSKIIVFDFGSEMYIWYGKNVPLESRRKAAQLAQELFDEGYNYEECHINPLNAAGYQGARATESNGVTKTSKSRPEWAILSKGTQHMETILFKEKFLDWPDYTRVIQVKTSENKSESVEINPCDAEEMWSKEYQEPDLILEGSHLGRGTSYYDKQELRNYDIRTRSVIKWVVQEYEYHKIDNELEMGEFFSGDSYIIRWEYQINMTGRELNGKPSKHNVTGRDRCAYFCWQGRDASSNEKGTAALLTVELDLEKGPQLRVAQGNEPPAFLNLFQGNLILHQGKRDTDKSRYRLFVTRGNLPNEAYLLQVPCSVRQLRSRGSLLLADTEKGCLYIWHGSRSMKHTKNIAIELANKLIARKSSYLFDGNASNIKISEVKEGEEPKEVLDALGVANKQHYSSVLGAIRDVGGEYTPRLFHFTDLSGQFEANEVLSHLRHSALVTPFPFEQKELYSASQPALFLLDDGKVVWLWQGWWPQTEDGELELPEGNAVVGAFALRWQAMRAAALRTCEAYSTRAGRGGVSVAVAGLEPEPFVALFDTWVERDEAADANIAHGYKAGEALSGERELSSLLDCDMIVPLAALQRRPLPAHVQPRHLERHLTPNDFQEAFGMTKEEFAALPAWKQTNMKKEVGLF